MGISALVSPILIVSMIPSSGPSSLVAGTLSHARASNWFLSLRRALVGSSVSIVICLRGYLRTAPSMLAKESRKDGSGGR